MDFLESLKRYFWIANLATGGIFENYIYLIIGTIIFLIIGLFLLNKKIRNKILWIIWFLILTIISWLIYDSYLQSKENIELVKDNKEIEIIGDWDNIKLGKASNIKCVSNKLVEYNKTHSNFWSFLWWFESNNYWFKVSKDNIEYTFLNWENLISKYWYSTVNHLSFSDDKENYAFIATKEWKKVLVKDWKEFLNNKWYSYNWGFWIIFSKNKEKILHKIEDWGKIFFAINWKKISDWYDRKNVPEILYSDNFEAIVYKKNKRKRKSGLYNYDYFLNWKNLLKDYDIEEFKLSSDWSSYMYTVKMDKTYFLVKDWKMINKWSYIWDLEYLYNWDFVYFLNSWKYMSFVINWVEQKRYNKLGILEFTNNYKSFNYIKYSKSKKSYYYKVLLENWKKMMVINWNEDSVYSEVETWSFVFSNNEKKYAYVAKINDNSFVVYNWLAWDFYKIDDIYFNNYPVFYDNNLFYIWSTNRREFKASFIVNNKKVKDFSLKEKGTVLYKNIKLIDWPYNKYISSIDMKWNFLTSEKKDNNNIIWRTEEITRYVWKYEKSGYHYLWKDNGNSIFLWQNGRTRYIVKNWEEIISTNNFVSWIYPIDGWKSFMYDVSIWSYTNRILVKCD